MPSQGHDLRPTTETVHVAGCRVTLVDAAGILTAAGSEPVELLADAAFPAPVRRVRLAVATGGSPVHQLTARIHVDAAEAPPVPGLGPAILAASAPVAALIAHRLAQREPFVTWLTTGAGAASPASRWLGLDQPPAGAAAAAPVDRVREDPAAGLRASVTHATGADPVVTVHAEVPSGEIAPAHLLAMTRLVLQVVAELVDGADPDRALAGRAYVLRHHCATRAAAERVTLDQVGGLADVVAQFREIAISFRHPAVMARWGASRPQGILMYGPPGTGKTMLARALANEIGGQLREIRTPEILDKWMGASERNIKQIFREARRYRQPTVMLFDEFDSIISYAGNGGDAASQAVNAVAGIFKQEMNSLIDDNPNVVVVATTNFPHRVDESLTRSGRFNIRVAIPLPDDRGRAEIFAKMIRELIARHEGPGFRMFADDVDPARLAGVTERMSGADIREVLRRAQLAKAMQEARSGTPAAPIGQADLERCIAELRACATTGARPGYADVWRADPPG